MYNLIIKLFIEVFLFRKYYKEAKEENKEKREELPLVKKQQIWWYIDFMGKLHNIVLYIKLSFQQAQIF